MPPELRQREFLTLVAQLLPQHLPEPLRAFNGRVEGGMMLKVFYHSPRIHYEVHPLRKTGRIEIGLHFEAERETSYRLLARFAECFVEVQAALGPSVEPEEWTNSWTRLHETWPLTRLDDALAQKVAARLGQMISVLQPMLECAR
ncbi:MAG: hypothetical protein HY677_07270, partial [Chloroflexi bacterium]|nr:hypothetical protein [Chloroflexota bacterium]